ncbi:MAG TPA: cytochrome c biogenesis protein [Acidobacteriota bacterium]|nr:cytochrome c biogenesis protein [Acidobacteriota bacterium]
MDQRLQSRLDTALGTLMFCGMLTALYMALIEAPREITMGDLQRIFYFHVSAAIAGFAAFAVNFSASLLYLLRRNRQWDRIAVSAAEVGVIFFGMVLITGPIWAKPVWMVWWTWSPRLTTSLVLFLLYAGYLLLRTYFEDPERRAIVSAVFGIVAFIDAPIVWFSIRWWRDIHPGPVLESGGLAASMRPALYVCLTAFMLLMVYLMRRRYFLESMRDDLEQLQRRTD